MAKKATGARNTAATQSTEPDKAPEKIIPLGEEPAQEEPTEPEPEPEPTFGSCNVSGQVGTCIDTGISSCGGQLHTGYCSGGSAIRCCVESGGTDFGVCNAFGNPGQCIDTQTTGCNGELYSGFCPGSSSIRCCAN